ncbi:hypothetical protein [Micromonospora sp. WMMD1274]|uniref:hypothetical protein n=1 Tax=Micromonospora sp. WMMD1274 TaxID=3404116 RepID=UPI003B96233F
MSNPNPARISDPMWRLWTEFSAFEPAVKLGGIYADKAGYHNRRSALAKTDYSVEDLAADRQGPSDKASAWDLTLPEAKMKLYSKRLADACKSRDPRLFKDGQPIIREFIGTLDGKTVYCYVLTGGKPLGVGADAGPDPGRDKSHLWHVHISLIRKFINDWEAIAGILAILKGEPIEAREEVDMTPNESAQLGYVDGRVLAMASGTDTVRSDLKGGGSEVWIVKKVKELDAKLDQVIAAPPGSVTITDEQLERVLRKVIGSVDETN